MNRTKHCRGPVVFALVTMAVLLGAAAPAAAEKSIKKLATWLVYEEEKGFDRIERNADILASLSVVGNPPREFIDRCHKLQIEVYHAVMSPPSAFDTPERAKATVEEYVKACTETGFDGIDLDFENLDPALQDKYSDFLLLVSSGIHRLGKKVSHCVGFYPGMDKTPPKKLFYDPWVVAQTCDLVRVMCYDLYWAPGFGDPSLIARPDTQGIGPTSTCPWARAALAFWLDRVPRRKLIMGLPAYSNDYTLTPVGKGRQVYAPAPEMPPGARVQKAWLWYDRVPVYLYDDRDGAAHLFYASDAESTKAHLETAAQLKLAGVGFWHFSSVADETWETVRSWLRAEAAK